MTVAFVELAQSCAPLVEVRTLAAVISLESRFKPFAIRVNSGPPLPALPASKAEAIERATSLVADHQDIQIGLGGIGITELRKLKLSISDAFDPCENLKATATLLDGYYRSALSAGEDAPRAEKMMLQSYYGRGDPSVGKMVQYDEQVRQEMARLIPKLASLLIAGPRENGSLEGRSDTRAVPADATSLPQADGTAPWDVFDVRRRSSVLVFQNDRSEQSE